MNIDEKELIKKNILEELNIRTKEVPNEDKYYKDKNILSVLNKYLKQQHNFLSSINEVICKEFNLDYQNISKSKIDLKSILFTLKSEEVKDNILIDVNILKSSYFLSNRELKKFFSYLIPIAADYYEKKEVLDINTNTAPLNITIDSYNLFQVVSGTNCNHRPYGLARILNYLTAKKIKIPKLTKTFYEERIDNVTDFIHSCFLKKLSNGLFIIEDSFDINYKEIKIKSNNDFFYIFRTNTNPLYIEYFQVFIENFERIDKNFSKYDIFQISFEEYSYMENTLLVNITPKKGKETILYLNIFEINILSEYKMTNKIKYLINYFINKHRRGDNEFYINEISSFEEKSFYLHKAFNSLNLCIKRTGTIKS